MNRERLWSRGRKRGKLVNALGESAKEAGIEAGAHLFGIWLAVESARRRSLKSPEGRASPRGGPPSPFPAQVSKEPTTSPLSRISRLSSVQLPSGTAMVKGSITWAQFCSVATWEIISISITSPSSSTVQKIS